MGIVGDLSSLRPTVQDSTPALLCEPCARTVAAVRNLPCLTSSCSRLFDWKERAEWKSARDVQPTRAPIVCKTDLAREEYFIKVECVSASHDERCRNTGQTLQENLTLGPSCPRQRRPLPSPRARECRLSVRPTRKGSQQDTRRALQPLAKSSWICQPTWRNAGALRHQHLR